MAADPRLPYWAWRHARSNNLILAAITMIAVFLVLFVVLSQVLDSVGLSGSNAGGILVVGERQKWGGSNLDWRLICRYPHNASGCVGIGAAAPIPQAGLTVMTYNNGWELTGASPSWGILEMSDLNESWIAGVSTPCETGTPFYPGFGTTVFLSCNTSVVEFNYVEARVTGSIAVPGVPQAFGIDPALGVLYVGVANGMEPGRIVAVNLTTTQLIAQVDIPAPGWGDTFGGAWNWLSWSIVFDPSANVVLSQTGDAYLVVLDPTNLSLMSEVPTGTSPWAMFLDPDNEQLYVGAGSGDVLALNDTSLAVVANISVSNDACSNGGSPFYTDSMALDAAQGDLFLGGYWYCMGIINTTNNYALATVPLGGDGPSLLAWDPTTDLMWVTYSQDLGVSAVIVGHAQISDYYVVSSVARLPPLPGELVLSLALWVPVTALVILGVSRLMNRRRPPIGPT